MKEKETKKMDKLFVLRVNPDGKKPMFKRIKKSGEQGVEFNGKKHHEIVFHPTPEFENKMELIFEKLKPWVKYALEGPLPKELEAKDQFIEKMFF